MRELFDKHIAKIVKVIHSCKTHDHIATTREIVTNFINYWKWRGINPKTLKHYLKHFQNLIHYRLKIINYEFQ